MNPDLRSTCIPLIVFVLAAGCDQDIADVVPSTASANADQADVGAAAVAVTSTMPIPNAGSDSERDGERDPGDPPMIDFSMLDEARRLDFIDAGLTFPESLEDLDGRRVRLIGFMAPFDDLRNMRRCMILPSYVGCKFCSPPSVTQVVFVTKNIG